MDRPTLQSDLASNNKEMSKELFMSLVTLAQLCEPIPMLGNHQEVHRCLHRCKYTIGSRLLHASSATPPQNMRRPELGARSHLGIDVSESQGRIILVDDVCRDLLGNDLIKNGWSALISSCFCPVT